MNNVIKPGAMAFASQGDTTVADIWLAHKNINVVRFTPDGGAQRNYDQIRLVSMRADGGFVMLAYLVTDLETAGWSDIFLLRYDPKAQIRRIATRLLDLRDRRYQRPEDDTYLLDPYDIERYARELQASQPELDFGQAVDLALANALAADLVDWPALADWVLTELNADLMQPLGPEYVEMVLALNDTDTIAYRTDGVPTDDRYPLALTGFVHAYHEVSRESKD